MSQISKKIVLTGHFNVGKSSLTRQFVHKKFSEDYLTTIGVNIEKKQLSIDGNELNLILWDLAGEDSLRKTHKTFLKGSHGIIYVFDLTRESTYSNIPEQLGILNQIVPDAKTLIIGNKNDLISKFESDRIISSLDVNCDYTSSAKTGDNVEDMFIHLAKSFI